MSIRLEAMTPDVRESVVDILNYYVENSFAAYMERKLPYEFFDVLFRASQGYPAVVARNDDDDEVVGFALLRAHNSIPAFSQTAEITYFIKPDYTGRGIGSYMLNHLTEGAKQRGIRVIMASISSRNEGSIAFHLEHGFAEVGRFIGIGQKHGEPFDVVWMQKSI